NALITNIYQEVTCPTLVVTHMKSIFARHGIPQVVCSDNGPCYSSKDFQKFAEEYGFQHVTSKRSTHSEVTAQESSRQSIGSLFSSAELPYFATRTWCVSCRNPDGVQITDHTSLLTNYDKASKGLEPLSNNDTVRLEDHSTWSKRATVLDEVNPISYTVRTEDGQILRRNRRSLLKTKETVLVDTSTEDTGCAVSQKTSETLPVLDDKEPAEDMHSPVLRRSKRTVKPPDRLNL
uniref:Integrase catalytic domain-containing protein n=1 Tax=Sinocyclocheilus grahami TaxID=75366 RepID=A0A672S0A1_SINGR